MPIRILMELGFVVVHTSVLIRIPMELGFAVVHTSVLIRILMELGFACEAFDKLAPLAMTLLRQGYEGQAGDF